ncbi:MAG: hypothetical protein JSS12_10230 [Verrucomicrobia bacterium]|nr:hypothetical protein [Verrucomicrobiota bacterium]
MRKSKPVELKSLFQVTASALLGAIREQLRAAKVDIDEQERIYLHFYWDGEISQSDEETIQHVINEIKKNATFNFPGPYNFLITFNRLDFPQEIPNEGYFVYLRDESIFNSSRWIKPTVTPTPYRSFALEKIDELRILMIYALLGRVRPNLRYIWIALDEWKKLAYFSFYFDGKISNYDNAVAFGIVETAQQLFWPGMFKAKISINRLDFPAQLPWMGHPIYLKDESIESELEQENSKEWTNLKTGDTFALESSKAKVLSCIRATLAGEVRKNCRAIQLALNQVKQKANVWFHFSGEIYDSSLMVAERLKEKVQELGYIVNIEIERLDLPAAIPHLGEYLFLRKEEGVDAQTTECIDYKKIKKLCSDEVATKKLSTSLRAIFVDVDIVEKVFYIFFACREIPNADINNKIQALANTITEGFAGFSHEIYYSPFSSQEKIFAIGTIVYQSSDESVCDELDARSAFFLSITKALTGEIKPNLRAVKAELDTHKKIAYYWFYFDYASDISESSQIAKLATPEGYEQKVTTDIYLISSIGHYIYKRYEN